MAKPSCPNSEHLTQLQFFRSAKAGQPIRGQVKNQRAFTNTRVFCVDQSLLMPSVAMSARSLLFRALTLSLTALDRFNFPCRVGLILTFILFALQSRDLTVVTKLT